MKLSVVVPVFNEEVYLESFFADLQRSIIGFNDVEYIFVDDASTDYSSEILANFASKYDGVKIIRLDKNYGKQVAITAGMDNTTGDAVVVTTVNPYKPHEVINEAIRKWQHGYDIVRAEYKPPKGQTMKKLKFSGLCTLAKVFGIKGKLFGKATVELYDKDVVDVLKTMPDKNMYLRNINSWVDINIYSFTYYDASVKKDSYKQYKQKKAKFDERRKQEGKTKYKPEKTRLYGPSLYCSWGAFVLFVVLLTLTLVLSLTIELGMLLSLFLWVSVIVSFISSALLYFRAVLIKKLGVIPWVTSDQRLYNINEII